MGFDDYDMVFSLFAFSQCNFYSYFTNKHL